MGGYNGSTQVNSVYYASLGSGSVGTWTSTTAYPTNVYSMPCATDPGYMYCVGGVPETASVYSAALQLQTPAQDTQNLISLVNRMNLPGGVTQSLVANLQAALKSIDMGQNAAAKNQLQAFINEVNAQTGKKITGAQAAQLIAAASAIISTNLTVTPKR